MRKSTLLLTHLLALCAGWLAWVPAGSGPAGDHPATGKEGAAAPSARTSR